MKRLKFTEEQEQRRKEVHESILDSCKVITQDDNIKIRDYYLEDMAEFMSEVIADVGYKAHYPAIVYLGDDEKAIKEYIEKGDTTNMGKKMTKEILIDIIGTQRNIIHQQEKNIKRKNNIRITCKKKRVWRSPHPFFFFRN